MRITTKRARVTEVTDGNTFRTSGGAGAIRLASVRVPAPTTRSGAEATAELRRLVQGREVRVEVYATDEDGSALASVKLDNKSVNLAMNRWLESRP